MFSLHFFFCNPGTLRCPEQNARSEVLKSNGTPSSQVHLPKTSAFRCLQTPLPDLLCMSGAPAELLLICLADKCFLTDNIYDYYNVSQGKITIPNVDDGEEFQLTDVSKTETLVTSDASLPLLQISSYRTCLPIFVTSVPYFMLQPYKIYEKLRPSFGGKKIK
jgi:hypothetical protein